MEKLLSTCISYILTQLVNNIMFKKCLLHDSVHHGLGLGCWPIDVEAHGPGVGPAPSGLYFGLRYAQSGAVGGYPSSRRVLAELEAIVPYLVQQVAHIAQS